MRDSFRRFGLSEVHQTARSYAWKVSDSSLSVDRGSSGTASRSPTPFMGGEQTGPCTGPAGITAPIVDVGNGSASTFASKDVSGKVVMFDLRFLGLPADVSGAISKFTYDPDNTVQPGEVIPQPYISNIVDVVQRAGTVARWAWSGCWPITSTQYYFNEEYRKLHRWTSRACG